jgi:hypothetical protein
LTKVPKPESLLIEESKKIKKEELWISSSHNQRMLYEQPDQIVFVEK